MNGIVSLDIGCFKKFIQFDISAFVQGHYLGELNDGFLDGFNRRKDICDFFGY